MTEYKEAMVVLNRKRGGIKGQVTKLLTCDLNAEVTDEAELQTKIEKVSTIEIQLDELRVEYYKTVDEKDLSSVEDSISEVEEELTKLKVRLKRIDKLLKINVNDNTILHNESVNLNNESKCKVKLPQITLPKFAGDYNEWFNFKKQFDSIINSNAQLNDSQKLFYLQSSLTGAAKNIQTSEDTYESLYKTLVSRFENKRLIANSHLNEIFGFEKIAFESAKNLRNFTDSLKKNVRALTLMGLELNELSEVMLINMAVAKLDKETRKHYETAFETAEFPTWNKFTEFLEKRCQILENLQTKDSQIKPKGFIPKPKTFMLNENYSCFNCKKSHMMYKCPEFLQSDVKKRFETVKKLNLCVNCLQNSHKLSSCKSKRTCNVCSRKHHTLLHDERKLRPDGSLDSSPPQLTTSNAYKCESLIAKPSENENKSETASGLCLQKVEEQTVCTAINNSLGIIPTVIVYLTGSDGEQKKCRALLDTGSNNHFITKHCQDRLNLKAESLSTSIGGINNTVVSIKGRVIAEISNERGDFKRSIEMFVVPKITNILPPQDLNISEYNVPTNFKLADPEFRTPGKIDILLGVGIFFDILRSNRIKLVNSNLILQDSVFGFIVSGTTSNNNSENAYCGLLTGNEDLNNTMKHFWEIETIPEIEPIKSKEESLCEEHFMNTYKRDKTGRFVVQMPFVKNPDCLGESKAIALNRLNSLWNRLIKCPDLLVLYRNFIHEYLSMGHMEEVLDNIEPKITYYLPHHGVYRPENNTTPLRVVFNASSMTSSGESLNSIQLNGGVIQDDLFSILLRFRKYKYGITSDIKKMFRMIWIDDKQRDLLRILWKDEIDDPIKTYRLKTVTYGTTSAGYLATRVLKQLAIEDGNKFPLAASVILSDMYMDDLLTGVDDLDIGKELEQQLTMLLKGAGMLLHKWSSNNSSLLPDTLQSCDKTFNPPTETKALGLLWKPQEDSFSFKVNILDEARPVTKRTVLSTIARVFDPLGLLGPIVTKAKLIMQHLWQMKIDWNEPLPSKEANEWNRFISTLPAINSLNIPRFCLLDNAIRTELHTFCDASEKAYGAVVYIRCIDAVGNTSVKALCSKSKVAPLQTITIPRLELCGAVIGSKLVKKVRTALMMKIEQTYMWCDSNIVLAWIAKPLQDLKTFVKNRVSTIQQLTDLQSWHHVNSSDNPADLISRGIDPEGMQHCDLWWTGPKFLHHPLVREPTFPKVEGDELFQRELKEKPDSTCAVMQKHEPLKIIEGCSSFFKLQRIIGWCLRFIRNARNPHQRTSGPLKTVELSQALTSIVKNVQWTCFSDELKCLSEGKPLPSKSNLINLCPFVDDQGLLRVGGRLKNSSLPHKQKHPMLIPNKHALSNLIINHFHILYFHAGPECTLYLTRTQFWIPGARNLIRKLLKNCMTCIRVSAQGSKQLMADLPYTRVTPARVFSKVGVDFCGPFTIRDGSGRSKKTKKCYISVFVCFLVKAIHVEIVSDLTTEAFIGALRRFVARRGKPIEIFSDNGSNFIGANNEMRKILKGLFNSNNDQSFHTYLAKEGINWHFNPPAAPHFGGLWEAGVKSLKYHIKRVVGTSILSYEELFTFVTQIEAVLNSRPLCPLSNNPNDISVLTPGHFLIGSPLVALPDPDYKDTPINRLSRWQLVQKLVQHFWKKWSLEYLNRLQQRPKWCKGDKAEFKEGDVVLVKSDNASTLKWSLGRVERVHPGKDNIVRVVTIKTKNGTYQRPITKIAQLPYVN